MNNNKRSSRFAFYSRGFLWGHALFILKQEVKNKNEEMDSIALPLVMCLSLCACGSRDDTSTGSFASDDEVEETQEPIITTESQAIAAVKNEGYDDYNVAEQAIARKLGFNQFYSPDYGVCEAEQQNDGSWEVTLNGSMSGYNDEYHSDFDTMKFTLTATVTSDGRVRSETVIKKLKIFRCVSRNFLNLKRSL